MTSDARVTVAIVSYAHAEYIEQCVRSILAQTLPCRILIIDDCSPDETQQVIRDLVDDLAPQADIVTLLQQENIGLPANLNIALRLTETEYFVYLAGDDWSLPDRLQKQVRALDEAGADAGLCYSDCLRARPDGSLFDEKFSANHAHVFRTDSTDPYRDLLLVDNWIAAPTVMFRTAALRAVGGFDEQIAYEDHDAYVRIARDHRLVYLDEALSVHRELEDGLGRELFVSGNVRWLAGQLRTELKQICVERSLDAVLLPRVRVRAIRLSKLGGEARLVRDALRTVRRRRFTVDPAGWWHELRARARMERP